MLGGPSIGSRERWSPTAHCGGDPKPADGQTPKKGIIPVADGLPIARPKLALVVDDRPSHLASISAVIQRQGYVVKTAMSLNEAKIAVEQQESKGGFDLIVSDYDYGRTILQKHRMFDGFRFLRWCKLRGVGAEMVLHSTAFEPSNSIGNFFHRYVFGVIPRAEKMGILVRPKSDLIGDAWKLS